MNDSLDLSSPGVDYREIGLVITTFNRPWYTWRTFRQLRQSLIGNNTAIAVVDDASTSPLTVALINGLSIGNAPLTKIMNRDSTGFNVHRSLRKGWDYLLEHHDCRYLCNIDPDVVMKPGWLDSLQALHQRERARQGQLIVTGFDAHTHPVTEVHEDYSLKKSVGGLNMFFDAALYHEIVRPNLKYDDQSKIGWDWCVVEAMQECGYSLLCTRPSMLQHIGKTGKFSSRSHYDRAEDF